MRQLATRTPAADPRPDPAGRLVAYACGGALRVIDIATGADRAVADRPPPASTDPASTGVSFGLAEFIAAEEMERTRGYWWAPDGSALLVARVDENPVQRWYIADPASPAAPGREVRYPSAGTSNAEVTAFIATVDGHLTAVSWDNLAFPYLVTACWSGTSTSGDQQSDRRCWSCRAGTSVSCACSRWIPAPGRRRCCGPTPIPAGRTSCPAFRPGPRTAGSPGPPIPPAPTRRDAAAADRHPGAARGGDHRAGHPGRAAGAGDPRRRRGRRPVRRVGR